MVFHALLDRHRVATGADDAPAPAADEPGVFASHGGLARLAQMNYGG